MAQKKAVSKKEETALALPEDLVVPEGAGLEEADRDSFAIPFLAILQKMSPQADADHEAYIDGAKPGQFLDTVANEPLDAEKEKLAIIPVFYRRAFVEWIPRDGNSGGGYVGEHTVAEAGEMKWERDDLNRDILIEGTPRGMPGNQIVDTRYHYVILVRGDGMLQPMVIAMSSTQVKKSKRLMSDMDLLIRSKGLKASFQLKYAIKTVSESNEHGTWRGWEITRDGLVAEQDHLDAAIGFYKAIKAGEVKEATDSLDPTGASEASGDNPSF